MLRLLNSILDTLQSPGATTPGAERTHTLELATAVLLIEVMRADGRIETAEREAVLHALRSRFTLTATELDELFELAHDKSEHTHDLYGFTARLNDSLTDVERVRAFEMLWTVAWADGHADAHETHLLRKLADLLHLRHAQDALRLRALLVRTAAAQLRELPGLLEARARHELISSPGSSRAAHAPARVFRGPPLPGRGDPAPPPTSAGGESPPHAGHGR